MAGVATSDKVAPVVNVALQFVPQFTAIGFDVTVPLPFPDLVRLPELFPFRIAVTVDSFRTNKLFSVQRQGAWDMVGLVASNGSGLLTNY